MSGITITDVKVVGFCSKHRNMDTIIQKDKNGRVYTDDEIYCIGCDFEKGNK